MGTRASTQGSAASNLWIIGGFTNDLFHLGGRPRFPSGGPNQPQGRSSWSTKSVEDIVTMHHELTRSTGQGATSAAEKVFDCMYPGIMASLGSRLESAGRGEVLSATVGALLSFSADDSVSESDVPNIARFNERPVAEVVLNGGVDVDGRRTGFALAGRRLAERDLARAARRVSLSSLRSSSGMLEETGKVVV